MSNRPNKNLVRTKRIPLPPGAPPAVAVTAAEATDTTEWLGAYFIVDHQACGLANLPGTEGDATGFIQNETNYQKENFLYGDSDVLTQDFAQGVTGVAGADDGADPNVPAGRNGVDSVVIAYLATHGVVNSNGDFVFAIGSQSGSCRSIRTEDMVVGDGRLRYFFVSTCESVKTVNPGKQWFPCAKGLRAVFGYDGTIADSPDYGRFFFEEWKKNGVTTTQAFIRASWRVNPDQIAVAAWFGQTAADAQNFCDTETHFQHEPIDAQFIAHHQSRVEDLLQAAAPTTTRSMTLMLDSPAPMIDPTATLGHFVPPGELHEPLVLSRSADNVSYRTSGGTYMVRNVRSGSLDITFPRYHEPPSVVVTLTNAEAISAATTYLTSVRAAIPGIQPSANGLGLALVPGAVRRAYSGMASRDGVVRDEWCTDVTVVFRQTVNGIPTIGTGGLIEVTLDGSKQVSRLRAVTRVIAAPLLHGFPVPFPLPFPVPFPVPFPNPGGAHIDVLALKAQAEERAKGHALDLPNVSSCRVVKSEVGFYAADEAESQHSSELTVRVLVEFKTDIYSRSLQLFYTVGDLAGPAQQLDQAKVQRR